MKTIIPILLGCLSMISLAGPRTSADYTLAAEDNSGGGGTAASAGYTAVTSCGGIAGIGASTDLSAKTGYIGQLYTVAAVEIGAATTSFDEGTTLQLDAALRLDDGTLVAGMAADVVWSVQSGPLAGISETGLATGGTVYQNTAATARAECDGASGTLGLTVVNVTSDDFDSYAGDGIDDDWQVGYFGEPPNSNAGPDADPDADQQDNLLEFLSGFSPVDSAERFQLTIDVIPMDEMVKQVTFTLNRVIPGRTYVLMHSDDPATGFGGFWDFQVSAPTENWTHSEFFDAPRQFFRVEISKP